MAEQTKDQFITEQLTARGLKNTAANRKKLGTEYENKYMGGKPGDWRSRFKMEFPAFSDLVDGAEGETAARQEFGDDLIDLFLDFAKNPDKYDLTSQAGQQVWKNKVQATNLYTKVSESRRQWTLTPEVNKREQIEAEKVNLLQEYGSLELDDRQLVDIATYRLSNKASAAQTKYYVYSIIANRTAVAGGPVALGETDEATNLRNGLKRYNYNPPGLEDQITSALTGQAYNGVNYTADLLLKKARDNAKILMPQFSQQFDEGYTIEDVFEPYRNVAAATLEMNPDDIKYTDPKFRVALNKRADGLSMTAQDWEYMLKKDPTYKWSETRQGKKQASDMIGILERALGQYI